MKLFVKLFFLCLTISIFSFGVSLAQEGAELQQKVTLFCIECIQLDGFVKPGQVNDDIRKMVGKYNGGSGAENVAIQKSRGVTQTDLKPKFSAGGKCPTIDSEKWAIDYTHKRKRPALHKGIDIPQPRGTPILAVAAGVVVGKFLNEGNRKGIEIVLRHSSEQSGLPFWTYSQYTHLLALPKLPIGSQVSIGEEIGKTANTGKMGKRERRDALHFAILYSRFPEWSNDGVVVTPKDGFFMDPNAFYRTRPPYDSGSLYELSGSQKFIAVPYMKIDGTRVPVGATRIWPYACK